MTRRRRARAGGRTGGRSATPEVRRPPRRAAPLRSGCSGSRAGSAGRAPADRTTSPSSLPAGPRFPEGTRSQVLLLDFLPSLFSESEPVAAVAPRAARGESRVERCVSPRSAARVGMGGKRWARARGRRGSSAVGRSRGVCACPPRRSCLAGFLGSSFSRLRGQSDTNVFETGCGPGCSGIFA